MKMSKSAGLDAFVRRSFFTMACAVAAVTASQHAVAGLEGSAAYNTPYFIPGFVTDVRALIADSATRHTWRIVEERPGELVLQLDHARAHMTVVAKARYTRSELWFERVGASTYQCVPEEPCKVVPEIVQRWMVTLRREVGISLLRMAIKDAGGTVTR
jgi:hypothetical protein